MGAILGCKIIDQNGVEYLVVRGKLDANPLSGLSGTALAAVVKKLREERKISQRALAKKVGITHAHLNRIEMGKVEKPHQYIITMLGELLTALPVINT